MPGLPKSGHDWAIMSTRPSLTPLADVGRSAGQAPLHGVRPAGVGAADDNVEIGTRLLQRAHIDVSALRRLPDVADALGTMGERVLEEPLRAFASLGRLWL